MSVELQWIEILNFYCQIKNFITQKINQIILEVKIQSEKIKIILKE